MEGDPHLFSVGDLVQPKQVPIAALWNDLRREKSTITEIRMLRVKSIDKVRFADTVVFEEVGGIFNANHFTKVLAI